MPAASPDVRQHELAEAIDGLDRDLEKVEFWAAALTAFLQPIPSYDGGDGDFLVGGTRAPRGPA